MPQVTLWLKAGSDGQRLGGDPTNQHLFMLLMLKEKCNPDLKVAVRTVNEAKAPPEFRQAGLRKTPAMEVDDDVLTHLDDIVDFLEQFEPRRQSHPADDVTSDLFRHFAFFIKEVNKDPKALLGELNRIDSYMSSASTSYLTSDEPTFLDTVILPRLHTIRIAAKALKEFEIPANLKNLWRYMHRGYTSDLFKKSCPSDQEIILYWTDRSDTPDIPSQKRAQLYRQKSEYTFTVPDDL